MSILEKNISIIFIKDIKFGVNLKETKLFILTQIGTKMNKNNKYMDLIE